jgi:hypothetical protein
MHDMNDGGKKAREEEQVRLRKVREEREAERACQVLDE